MFLIFAASYIKILHNYYNFSVSEYHCCFNFYLERIQLTYGFKNSAGHVEIFDKYHNDYKPVCDKNWDLNDANVVCHQLGYPGAAIATARSYFTYRNSSSTSQQSTVIFNNVDCTGLEESLFDCPDIFGIPLTISTLDSCPSQRSAGVICNGRLSVKYAICIKVYIRTSFLVNSHVCTYIFLLCNVPVKLDCKLTRMIKRKQGSISYKKQKLSGTCKTYFYRNGTVGMIRT